MQDSLIPENQHKNLAMAGLAILAICLLYWLRGFLADFLGAIILYVLCRPIMEFLIKRWKWNANLGAIAIILMTFVVILLPTFFIANLFYAKVSVLLSKVSIDDSIHELDRRFKAFSGIAILTEKNLEAVQQTLGQFFASLLSQSLSILGDIGILYILLFYLLRNTGKVESFTRNYLPLSSVNLQIMSKELEVQIFSNSLGAPVLAILQGIVASLGFMFFDVPDAIFWGMLAGLLSIIPVVGSALIWLPAALMPLSRGEYVQGLGLIAYGVLIISTIDNLFRFVFQKRIADVHPLITILGVVMGLEVFGLPGVIFGPLLLSYFLLLFRMYRKAYVTPDPEEENSTELNPQA